MLYIRADGNTDIGMGHVMRCLSIAEAAADLGCSPVFITADNGCLSMIEERGFRAIVLNTDYRDMLSEIPQLKKIVKQQKDMLLIDSYQADDAYFDAVKEFVQTACLEDMEVPHPVCLLINYNIYAPQLADNYKELEDVLLGIQYMPLRKAFQAPCEYQIKDKITDVMITTGGSDPYFAAAAFMDAILADTFLSKQKINWHIVSGPFNRFAEELKNRYQSCKNVCIHENVKDMRELLLQTDVVLTAAGSTVYEVSSLGIPMIVFYFAENQRQGACALAELTQIVNAGCFAKNSQAVTDRAVKALHQCVAEKTYRERLYEQERQLVDGKGAQRIAKALMDRTI